MVEIRGRLFFLLVISGVLAFLSLLFSLFVYTYDYSSKLAAHSSSEASVGFSIEVSNSTCGDALCNGAETCSICSEDCGECPVTPEVSTSTGGGGGYSSTPNFVLDINNFNLKVVSGNSETNEIIVENTGPTILDIAVSVTGIQNYIYFDSNTFSLKPGERKSLKFTITAPEPGVYAGKILLTYQGITREVLILLNVVSEGVLFDATITVPDLYRILREGQRIPALIELLEIGAETGVDVTMNYVIKDFDGNVRYTESETFYVKGAKSYSKRFSTSGLEPGDYILGVELIYPGGFATSTSHFKISDSLITPQTWVSIGAIVIALAVCAFAVVLLRQHKYKLPKRLKK